MKKKKLLKKKVPRRTLVRAAARPAEPESTDESAENEAPADEGAEDESEDEEDDTDAPGTTVAPDPPDEPPPASGAVALDAFDLAGSSTDGEARIHEIGAMLGRVWGTHTAMPMAMAPVVNIQRMPIGIITFDAMTGGGLVIGRSNRLKGKKDTLKSTMCLRALRAAQRTCRHCKFPIVMNPETGRLNCRCPEKRFWIANEDDYGWLPAEAAIRLYHGLLPEGTESPDSEPFLPCEPPPHLAGKKGPGGKVFKRRPIPFAQMRRCEPMRCAFVDTERTIDAVWAKKNGVNPKLVLLVGAKWAEQTFESVERIMVTREFDFAVIDSTSMLETREMLEDRKVGDRGTPAAKQKLMGDFIKRVQAAQADEGLAGRYAPTLLTTSHLTTKGIGGYHSHPHLGATDGLTVEHGVAMDILMKADRFIFDSKERKRAVYGQFTFTIDKNHCGGIGSTKTNGQIKFWLVDTPDHPVGDSNDLETVIAYARQFGDGFISEGRGQSAKLVLHSPYLSGERKPFSSIVKTKDFLRENDGIYDDLRARVLAKLIEDRASLQVVETSEPDGIAADGQQD